MSIVFDLEFVFYIVIARFVMILAFFYDLCCCLYLVVTKFNGVALNVFL